MQSLRQQMLRRLFCPRDFSTGQQPSTGIPGDMSPQTRLEKIMRHCQKFRNNGK